MKKKVFLFILLFLPSVLMAQNENQSEEDQSVNEIEGLFKEEAQADERRQRSRRKKSESSPEVPKNLSDLKGLEIFSDIAVIQKRYLPKTGRFELYIAGGTNLNDAFFFGNGVNLSLGYNLMEKWAVEGVFNYIQNSARNVTNKLLEKGVSTEGSISTDQYAGFNVKWTPIYGKYAYLDKKIIPFDLYFSFGGGLTTPRVVSSASTSQEGKTEIKSPYTLRLGTGQIFAINKWMAFRWDLANHFIFSEIEADGKKKNQWNNNVFLYLGLSFFFPEAKYR